MTSIANLLAVGLEPVANTVLVRPALPGLTQLARELRAAGVSRLHLILPHQRGMTCEPATERDRAADRVDASWCRPATSCWPPCASCSRSPARSASPSTTWPSWRRRIGTAQRPVRRRLPRPLHRPGRPRARLRHHGRRPGLRGRLAARAAARGDLAHVQQPAAAARGARPRPGRVPRLPGRRRLRRRVLGAGALRGAGARRGRRLRRAVPVLRPGAPDARGARRQRPRRPPPRPAPTASPPAPAAASPPPAPTTTPSSTASEATDGAGVTRATAPTGRDDTGRTPMTAHDRQSPRPVPPRAA